MNIISCSCKSDRAGNASAAKYQDAKLGAGKRYANLRPGGGHTCTVCGTKLGGK